MSVEQLKADGYMQVESGIGRSELQTVMDGFRNFIHLPEQYKDLTAHSLTERGDGDFGYFRRIPGAETFRGIVSDNKDIFHFGASTRQLVEARASWAIPEAMRHFLDDAESLFWQAQATKRQALGSLGLQGAINHDNGSFAPHFNVLLDPRAACNDVLRLIQYYDSDSLLAKPHLDRSVTTLALGESHPGLRIAPCDVETPVEVRNERLRPVAYNSGFAKFFLGAGWKNIHHASIRDASLPLAWHDVVQTEQSVDDTVRRWSAILFSNPHVEWADYMVPGRNLTRPPAMAEAAMA